MLGTLLAGCATNKASVGSTRGGECRIVHTPKYAVKGRTSYDQNWVDDTTERLVGGCDQPRPAARPPELDRVARRPVVVAPPAAPVVPKKKTWRERLAL